MGAILLKFFIFHLAVRLYTLAILGVHCVQDVCLVQTLEEYVPGLPAQLSL